MKSDLIAIFTFGSDQRTIEGTEKDDVTEIRELLTRRCGFGDYTDVETWCCRASVGECYHAEGYEVQIVKMVTEE